MSKVPANVKREDRPERWATVETFQPKPGMEKPEGIFRLRSTVRAARARRRLVDSASGRRAVGRRAAWSGGGPIVRFCRVFLRPA